MDRGLDSWDPWAEDSQDPTPFVDRDEDQSAAERPRRGAADAADDDPSVAGSGGPATSRAPRAPRKPRTPRAAAPPAAAEGDEGPPSAPSRRSASSFGQRSGKGSFGKRPPAGGGNSSFGRRPAPATTVADDGDDAADSGPASVEGTSSAARAARKAERAAEAGSFGRRTSTGSFGKGGGAGSFGSRSSGGSSFGDNSSGFGRSGGKKKPRTWGVQLDAEVEEPVEVPAIAAAAETEDPPARAPSGSRGRAGSFDRPRRAEGESAPEMEDPEQVARQLCLAALTGTAKTRQQLADMLREREVPDEAAEAVLERFTEVGLIDDSAFAAMWIDSRQTGRGLSKRALAHELKAKGIDPEVAAVALEAVDPQAEWDTARALVAKKVPSMRRLDTATATRRMIGMLARKGYGGGLAAIVVREALEADGAAEDTAAVADDGPPELGETGVGTRLASRARTSVEDETEVGEGLTLDGVARARPVQRRSGLAGGQLSAPSD